MLASLGLWSHLLAAILYGALAVFQLRHWSVHASNRPLVSAFAVMSAWSIFLALLEPHALVTQLAESGRNLAFLAFMYGLLHRAEGAHQKAVKSVYGSVAAVVGLQIVVGGIMSEYRELPVVFEALRATTQILGLTIAAGALILVHNLYGQADPASRGAIKFPMLALAAMWAYDLNLYTVAYFAHDEVPGLVALRGVLLAALAAPFALGLRGAASWNVRISRAATFQSLSLIFILAYLLAMMSASRTMEITGRDWSLAVPLAIVAAMTAGAILLLVSAKARAKVRVLLAKHMFEHRYDYRSEWLRFSATIGRHGDESAPLEERIVKALADIGESPGGVLLLADGPGRLVVASDWNSKLILPTSGEGAGPLLDFLAAQAFVVDFADLRGGQLRARGAEVPVPVWLAGLDAAWAAIPLLHGGALIGLVLLEHPPFRRPLDWEDYDLFRAAGIQAASYLAEARTQQALADSRRFDEFNRRFAFILHDIKNLVSQLSLVARNAERHAGNPEFRADMIATLQSSVKKLNDMLARLAPRASREAEPPAAHPIQPVIDAVVAAKRGAHEVRAETSGVLVARIVPAALEQALSHLVQNAIDASPAAAPVIVRARESGGDVVIEVIDRGVGMSDDFIRSRLFQPFASTKEAGFGIGAYEARSLLEAMSGRLEVASRPGEGTRFTLILPAADLEFGPPHQRQLLERMRA